MTVIGEDVLHQSVRELAQRTRREIDRANFSIDDFESIAQKYNIKFEWQALSYNQDGHYSKDVRVITLNNLITSSERRNFSFCHELMHDRIDRNNELFEILHEFTINMSDKKQAKFIERLCNIGAAELLIPSDKLQRIIDQQDFSTGLIPDLCQLFSASSLAVAFQMISTANHACYLIIAERCQVPLNYQPALFEMKREKTWELRVVYSGNSPSAKYTMGRNYLILPGHVMYHALSVQGQVMKTVDDIPRRNSSDHPWEVNCDCLSYRDWVFGFFHETPPRNPYQLKLL